MNDRFKFRVWSPKRKKYLTFNDYNYQFINDYGELRLYPEAENLWCDFCYGDEIVEQCTGLKDKNGKLVFEGDVVEYDDEMFSVFYSQSTLQFGIMGEHFSIYGDKIKKKDIYVLDVEIVGNIHENPELMK